VEEEKVDRSTRDIISADSYAAYLGAELTDIKPGWAKVSLTLGDDHLNFMGLIHGGVIFSLADVAFGAAANSFGSKAMALSVNINFQAPAPPGDTITAEVELVSRAGKMGYYDMKVRDSSGKDVAYCSGWAYHTGKPLDGSE
jgi:acyl-CoA thioesterase